jgi:hypothetical protein
LGINGLNRQQAYTPGIFLYVQNCAKAVDKGRIARFSFASRGAEHTFAAKTEENAKSG